jgi:hypothetical protein
MNPETRGKDMTLAIGLTVNLTVFAGTDKAWPVSGL